MKAPEQAKLLREARKLRGLTQKQIGDLLEVDKQFISNFERGLAYIPAKHIKVLSKTLRVPVKRFVESYIEDEAASYKKGIRNEAKRN